MGGMRDLLPPHPRPGFIPHFLNMTMMTFFFKNREQKSKTGSVWEAGTSGMGRYKERVWEGKYGGNIMYRCM
jgi:hypothetical protein